MKTELVDVDVTRRNLVIEIPAADVAAEIEEHGKAFARKARVPGFRPGKVPLRVVLQRYRDELLHEALEHMIPHAVDEALHEHGLEPVETPEIKDMSVEEGQPLRFTASFETVPPIDPGSYESLSLRRQVVTVADGEVDQALEQMRQQAARYEPVEGRAVEAGDTVVVDLSRQVIGPDKPGEVERHEKVTIELGAAVNPPGFDEEIAGLEVDASKTFTVAYPADYAVPDLAGRQLRFDVRVGAIRRRVVPDLDDEFAKDLGEFDTLEALRTRVRDDLQKEAERESDRQVRGELLTQLASRVTFEVPSALVERELDRRVEELLRRLVSQRIDPRKASIDWEKFREAQRAPSVEAVRSTLVLDEVARRESLAVSEEEIDSEVAQYAARIGRAPASVRAELDKEGGLARLGSGLRREKAVDFLMARATIAVG